MTAKIRRIMDLVTTFFDRPPAFRRTDPMDTLVETILSQNTTDKNSHGAFMALKRYFDSWDELLKARTSKISDLIKAAGLANIKAKRIKNALNEIKRREGALSLKTLERLDDRQALEYLQTLNGVGSKTASCVLLFSFGRPVMPVDTHIFRVAKRLDILPKDADIAKAHSVLSRIVPKELIYQFHLGIIEHGRKTCRARNPLCGRCPLRRLCRYRHRHTDDKKG